MFYAEAMMDTQPWDYWQNDGVTPKGHGAEIVATLEGIIKREPNHPGALHLYIHAVEATTTPERAEAAADRLEKLMPGAGHIVHMPSHIYYRVGRYADAVKVNDARGARWTSSTSPPARRRASIRSAITATTSTSCGRRRRCRAATRPRIDAARALVKAVGRRRADGGGLPPAQLYLFVPIVTDLRFGKWDEVLAEPRASPDLKLDVAMSHLARGFAYANKGDFANATARARRRSQR